MLVEKSCVEILHLCGIYILVVFSDISEFSLDYKLPTTKNIEPATVYSLAANQIQDETTKGNYNSLKSLD